MDSRPTLHPRSIRGYVATLALLVTLPMVALVAREGWTRYQVELEQGAQDARRLAETTAAATTQLISNAEVLLAGSAASRRAELLDPDRCGDTLRDIASLAPYLTTVGVMDLDAGIVCSARPMSAPVIRPDMEGQDWYTRVLEGAHFGVGPPVYGEISDAWVAAMAVPIRADDGSVVGVLSSSLRLGSVQDIVTGVRIRDGDLVTIMDGERRVLARSHDADTYVGQVIDESTSDPDEEEFGPGRTFVYGGSDAAGIERAWASVTIPAVDWIVWAGIPASTVRGPALAAIRTDAVLTILTLSLMLVLALVVQRSYTRSARALVNAARSRGEDEPWPTDRGPIEFRTMAGQLKEAFEARASAEESAQAVTRRYRSILDNAFFGIVVSNREGTLLEVNPAFVAMMGYGTPDELKRVPAHELYSDISDRERLVAKIEEQGILRDEEVRWTRRDGREIVVRLNGRVVDIGGETCYEMILEDVTSRKDLENALRQSQKMEGVGQLAGGVAHDFNNLLTVIAGNAELARARVNDPDDPLGLELHEIADATERAQAVTRQLLELSRSRPVEEEALDINAIVEGLQVLFTRLLGEHISVERELADDLPRVWGDGGQVEQVLLNLVVNARDAMPDGGTLTIRTRAAEPGAPGAPPDDRSWVLLSVRDTGRGIEEDALERIFEPFYTTKPAGAGTGLGLATSLAAVTSMQGRLVVESEPGRGSEFAVWLPAMSDVARTEEPAADDRVAEGLPGPAGDETILVAEDDEGVSRFVCSVLELAGYSVTAVEDGQKAIETIENGTAFDLVLTDVVMPGRSGTDVVQAARARDPEARILLMSGYTGELPVGDLVAEDPDLLLAKPFTMAQLLERVRLILDRTPAPRV